MNEDSFLQVTLTDDDSMSIEDYLKSDDFYLLSFVEGKRVSTELIDKIKYFTNTNDKYADFLEDPHGTIFVSTKLKNIIRKYEKNIQIFDAPLYDINTQKKISGYFLLNFLNVVDAVDKNQSKYSGYDNALIKPVIIEELIPAEINVFKLKESIYSLYFRKELALAIYKEKMTGIEFLKTNSI